MAKFTVFVMVVLLAAATVSTAYATGATIPGLKAKRSRFLLPNGVVYNTPLPLYGCSKKTATVCLEPASPGPTCCDRQCGDTVDSADHCGGCNKVCKHGCILFGGRCVDLLSYKDNCGKCFNQCNKCTYGFCDYAH